MKNYKNLVPVVLVVLFLVGIYVKFDTNTSKINEYNAYLAEARAYREMEIYVDAEAYYLAAIDVNPNMELYLEVGDFYRSVNDRTAIKWGETIVGKYPDDALGYEYLLGVYKDVGKYADFFETYAMMSKRGVQSSVIEDYVSDLRKEYFLATGKYDDVTYYAGGLCAVKDDGYWMYIDQIGTQMTQKVYATAGYFFDGVAPISIKSEDFYYINSSGAKKYIVQKEKIKELGCYDDGLCTLYDGKEWGVYNMDGECVIGGFSNISSLSNGVVGAEKDGKWKIYDFQGEELISDSYDDIKQDEKGVIYRNERLFVKEKNKYYMIDVEGNKITEDAYEDVKVFFGDGYAAVKVDGKWGFADVNGEMIIDPKYDDARSFSNGFAAVMIDDQWGFIDISGEYLIECKFAEVRDFTSNGTVFIKQSGEWRLLRLYMMNY